MLTRPISSSGEQTLIIGLGGRWISTNATPGELADHRRVLHALAAHAEGAGRLLDNAAGYGRGGSETYAGQWAEEDGFGDNIFWAPCSCLRMPPLRFAHANRGGGICVKSSRIVGRYCFLDRH